MHRIMALVAVLVMVAGVVTFARGNSAIAQDATPDPEMAGDIIVTPTDLGIVDALPAAPALSGFYRLEFPPGATLSFEPGDPGLGLWVIESGTLTLRNFSGDIRVTRASDQATPGT